jgi:hypothetical protein
LSPVGDVASAVENVSAAYSGTIAAPHEYFDHTGSALIDGVDYQIRHRKRGKRKDLLHVWKK